jgi:hypothetical protein
MSKRRNTRSGGGSTKSIKRERWTTSEDHALITLQAKHGSDWEKTASSMKTQRTAKACQLRYKIAKQQEPLGGNELEAAQQQAKQAQESATDTNRKFVALSKQHKQLKAAYKSATDTTAEAMRTAMWSNSWKFAQQEALGAKQLEAAQQQMEQLQVEANAELQWQSWQIEAGAGQARQQESAKEALAKELEEVRATAAAATAATAAAASASASELSETRQALGEAQRELAEQKAKRWFSWKW